MYRCKRGDYASDKKNEVRKHLFRHIPQDQWPFTCPIVACDYYCRYRSDYGTHKATKQHQSLKLADLTSPEELKPNPQAASLVDTEWITEDTILQANCTNQIRKPVRPKMFAPIRKENKPPVDQASLPPMPETPKTEKRTDKHNTETPLQDESSSSTVVRPDSPQYVSEFLRSPSPQLPLDVIMVEGSRSAGKRKREPSETDLGEEIVKCRKDLTYHFQSLSKQMETRLQAQEDAQSSGANTLKRMDERLGRIQQGFKIQLGLQTLSTISIRTKLAGLFDQFFQLLGPMHHHESGEPSYCPQCAKCQTTEQLLFQMVNVTNGQLLNPAIHQQSSVMP